MNQIFMQYEFKLPDIGEGVVEGEIVRWMIKAGDQVKEDQPMLEIMTDKATVEIPSPVNGEVIQTIGSEGEIIPVGTTLVIIKSSSKLVGLSVSEGRQSEQVETRLQQKPLTSQPSNRHLTTPAVRRFALKVGVDLTGLKGTGANGRITRQDIEIAMSKQPESSSDNQSAPNSIPYRGIRKKIGDHLATAKQTVPHYTYVEEMDATSLVKLRAAFQRHKKEHNINYLPFIMKACAESLKEYPILNSTLDDEKKMIQFQSHFNIGVATATEEGLIVPVVKNVDQKNIFELSSEIQFLTQQARDGKIKLEDLREGTFTITSLGPLGGIMATPIINYPQVGILAIHKIEERPVVKDGNVVARHMMNLSLSLDHRVIDGLIGATFLQNFILQFDKPQFL